MIEKASFDTTRGDLQKMLKWISAPLDEQYNKAWLNVRKSEIHAVASMGAAVVSYGTFEEPFINNVTTHESVDSDAGVETIINLEKIQDYIDFVGGKEVTVSFLGNEDERLCRKMEIDGDIHVELFVPNSEADYNAQQTQAVKNFDEENYFIRPSSGERLSTHFLTDVEQFQRIIHAKEFEDFTLNTFPVVIEDGEFVLDASDENKRNTVLGSLKAYDVEGPDVSKSYNRGFAELFSNLEGEVRVGIDSDKTPMCVVRESEDGSIQLRYLLLPAE